jgi:hypothetical protein
MICDMKKERPVLWEASERQKQFLACPAREALYGGALGGGKTDCLLMVGVSQAQNPKHRAIFLRKSFPQLRSVIERSHELFVHIGGVYNVQTSTWTFPSGAKIEFAFLDSPTDQWRYAGRSFNCILWDELCEWPSEEPYVYLLSRLRTTKDSGLRLEVRSSANPLGVGASWVRRRFNIPDEGTQSECVDPATNFRRVFIPARITDNIHLLGSDYERQLQALPSSQRKALLQGRWDAVAGAVFSEFDHSRHVVEPFPIAASWDLWRGGDDGYRAEACVLWLCHDRDVTDTIYVVGELYGSGMTPEVMARRILAIDRSILIDCGEEIVPNDAPVDGIIDSAAFSDSGMGSRADEMNKLHCRWSRARRAGTRA